VQNAPDFPAEAQRAFLLAAIAKHEAGEQLPEPPPGWRLDRVAWRAVTRFAFLEYYFFYAYNDFERYQTAIFDNEHEGDDEGCCLVFDRAVINLAAAGGQEALIRAVPFAIITSVHEEYQDADLLRFVPPPIVGPGEPVPPARDVVDFTVYVAGGSHATYLTPGNHDLVDFQDTWSYVAENAPLLLILAPLVLVISIILAILEHFIDTEDFTSDDGLHGGPDDLVGEDPLRVASRLLALPMSTGNHIYQPRHEIYWGSAPSPASGAGTTGSSTRARRSHRRPGATSANCSTSCDMMIPDSADQFAALGFDHQWRGGVCGDQISVPRESAAPLSRGGVELVEGLELVVDHRLVDERPAVLGGLQFGV
jgi:hypothetical protein